MLGAQKSRKQLRHKLYKLLAILLIMNAFKWVPHPFGLNMMRFFGESTTNYTIVQP